MYLNQNIAHFRKLCGYTQEQLAERLGVTGQSVSKWENGITNPDVSILPDLSKALGVDINALFSEHPSQPKQISFTELPEACYDAILPLFMKAQRSFFGKKGVVTESELSKCVAAYKNDLAALPPKCTYMIDEGGTEHGSVFVSDAFTFIDRSYGGTESALLFDLDKAGEILSVIGKRNNRKVLKFLYEKQITEGCDTFVTPEEVASATGITAEAVNEAAVELRHIALLDEHEQIKNAEYKKQLSTLYPQDFIFVLGILRLAYIHASYMTCTALMYRDAKKQYSYDGICL